MSGGPKRRSKIAPALGAVVLWMVAAKCSRASRAAWATHGSVTERLSRVTPNITAELTRPSMSLDRIDALAGLAAVLLVVMMLAYQRAGRQTERIGEEHGSAAWGGAGDIKPYRAKGNESRLTFTATENLAMDGKRTKRNQNVLVIGSAGSRKTRSYVLPNLLDPRSAISFGLTDPKGEIYRMTHEKLSARGYNVRCLNLVDLRLSGGLNVLEYLDPDQPTVSILQLTETIVSNTDGAKPAGGGDPFWDRAERALLTAMISLAVFGGDLVNEATDAEGTRIEEPPSLVTVNRLVKQLGASEEDEGHQSSIDEKIAQVRAVLAQWTDLPNVPKSESDAIRDGLAFTAAQYRIFEQGAGKTQKSVIMSVGVRLAVLDVPDVQRILSHDTLELDRLGMEPGVVFCIIPDTHQSFKFISALFWQTVFNVNIYNADHMPNGELAIPIHFLLDEFPNIGMIPNFEKIISTFRSRKMSASVIIQALPQLKSMYRDDWETICGNCDSTLFLGGSEPTTTEWMSKRLGSSTIKVEDTSQSFGSNGSWSRSLKSQKRELMTPDELGQMDDEECIYILRGVKPFYSRKAKLYVG